MTAITGGAALWNIIIVGLLVKSLEIMAAILCNSMGSLCQVVGQCLSFPCRICGVACEGVCQTMGRALTSPFSPYLITTVALNLPPIMWGVRAAASSQVGQIRCDLDTWLWINAMLCLGHVLAAIYIVYRIQDDQHQLSMQNQQLHDSTPTAHVTTGLSSGAPPATDTTPAAKAATTTANYHTMHDDKKNQNNSIFSVFSSMMTANSPLKSMSSASPSRAEGQGFLSDSTTANRDTGATAHEEGEANSWQRMKQVLCYDMVVAIYILGAIFWLVWQTVGISQVMQEVGDNEDMDDHEDLCDSIHSWSTMSIVCGYIFATLVCITFACSFLCLRR